MMQHRLHNGSLTVVLCHHQNHFLFGGDGHIVELFILAAGAFPVQHRAAGGACRAGGVHHLVGAALIGHDDDQLIAIAQFGGVAGGLLLAVIQICQGFSSSHAFDGDSHDDAVSRDADIHLPAHFLNEFAGFFGVRHRHDDTLFGGLDAEKIQHALYGGAVPQQGDGLGQVKGRGDLTHTVHGAGIDNRDQVIHAAFTSHSSMISSSPYCSRAISGSVRRL